MFYSHEILSNTQYGVATIWLVATVGKSNQKRLTRKAIQQVNVPKACETIIGPGAPLALRLQGNLLYGVSRVYAQQCRYMLSDAEKTQSDMMAFFRVMDTSETDPNAGKSKRHQITLQDDPSFDPLSTIPKLDHLASVDDLVLLSTKFSSQGSVSQMTPMTQDSSSSGRGNSLLSFDIPQSSHSGRSYRLPTDLDHDSPFAKPFHAQDPVEDSNPFGLDITNMPGLDLNFDLDGNLIEFGDMEPQLPPLPGTAAFEEHLQIQAANAAGLSVQNGSLGGDNVIIMGEDALPDAEPFPKRPVARKATSSAEPSSESVSTEEAKAPLRRQRRRRIRQMVDCKDHVAATEIRSWSMNYLDNMKADYKPRPATTIAQARHNAKALLFDNGLAGIGRACSGAAHPLAEHFSGMALLAQLQGKNPEQDAEPVTRSRRRVSAEAFEDEQNEARNVRQKVDHANELGRGVDYDMGAIMFGEDIAPEMGMDAANGLEDRHSSSMPPWSRPPSAAPGSSIRGQGSTQKRFPAPSPLHARGSAIRLIERWSDQLGPQHGSDDLAMLHSQDSSIGDEGFMGDVEFGNGDDTQCSGTVIDASALDFLGYATSRAESKGYTRSCDQADRRWIDFNTLTDELDDPANSKKFASEAFMHVLVLATKNAIAIEQDGIADKKPFGTIRIGLTLPQQEVDMADEPA
ncbi:Meiotic recombination protein rec8 [Fusarium oxysporum f. sp. rapae]|uniref:Meiotic recombination protein rec8 n=1 Tax=Fusarium oxysporum f. sp. rapae TaxID=485398 RepID=A0A8J5P0L0_FUSOX|nr:Meiotic recombination protein rec8 [Fusarium oxysporum f. sp. rapae]